MIEVTNFVTNKKCFWICLYKNKIANRRPNVKNGFYLKFNKKTIE